MTNPIADISVPELSRRIASLERQEVGRAALDVCTLTMDLRHKYRRALVARVREHPLGAVVLDQDPGSGVARLVHLGGEERTVAVRAGTSPWKEGEAVREE